MLGQRKQKWRKEKLDFHQKQKTKVENKNSSVFNTNSPLYFEFVLKLNKKIEWERMLLVENVKAKTSQLHLFCIFIA